MDEPLLSAFSPPTILRLWSSGNGPKKAAPDHRVLRPPRHRPCTYGFTGGFQPRRNVTTTGDETLNIRLILTKIVISQVGVPWEGDNFPREPGHALVIRG